jgi:hypothetical protein
MSFWGADLASLRRKFKIEPRFCKTFVLHIFEYNNSNCSALSLPCEARMCLIWMTIYCSSLVMLHAAAGEDKTLNAILHKFVDKTETKISTPHLLPPHKNTPGLFLAK